MSFDRAYAASQAKPAASFSDTGVLDVAHALVNTAPTSSLRNVFVGETPEVTKSATAAWKPSCPEAPTMEVQKLVSPSQAPLISVVTAKSKDPLLRVSTTPSLDSWAQTITPTFFWSWRHVSRMARKAFAFTARHRPTSHRHMCTTTRCDADPANAPASTSVPVVPQSIIAAHRFPTSKAVPITASAATSLANSVPKDASITLARRGNGTVPPKLDATTISSLVDPDSRNIRPALSGLNPAARDPANVVASPFVTNNNNNNKSFIAFKKATLIAAHGGGSLQVEHVPEEEVRSTDPALWSFEGLIDVIWVRWLLSMARRTSMS